MKKIIILILAPAILLVTLTEEAGADRRRYSDRYEVRQFVREFAAEQQLNRAELLGMFRRAKRQQSVLDAISRPAERKLTWTDYRLIFVTDDRAMGGVKFWQENGQALHDAEQKYGVPAEIIVAIIGVETRYGKTTGAYPVFDSLVTLGFDGESRKSFFRSELKSFLLLARDEQFDPTQAKGSYAGAMGIPQFIASSYRAYAVDFDGDGKRDLFANPTDAIGSVANYFKRHGWQAGETIVVPARVETEEAKALAVGRGRQGLKPTLTVAELVATGVKPDVELAKDKVAVLIELEKVDSSEYWLGLKNFYVITRYNNSSMYSMAVHQLAQQIKQSYALAQKSAVVANP
ncbi:MAG: lytic murein transglycosylase B [Gammaproteobacteria bacterium]|nr:lytic murein transglycosylase B [Gammaproteobacteria bacterium]